MWLTGIALRHVVVRAGARDDRSFLIQSPIWRWSEPARRRYGETNASGVVDGLSADSLKAEIAGLER